MFLHHRNQNIAWQSQKFGIESTHYGGGHFDEVGYFVQQTIFDDGFPTDEVRGFVDLCHDGGFAFFFI